jgi:hypothetical protein
MQDPKFYNQNGTLTAYSFACGYVEKKESETHTKQLYMEHSHYHVRAGKKNEYLNTWEVFNADELTKARKFFNSINLMN